MVILTLLKGSPLGPVSGTVYIVCFDKKFIKLGICDLITVYVEILYIYPVLWYFIHSYRRTDSAFTPATPHLKPSFLNEDHIFRGCISKQMVLMAAASQEGYYQKEHRKHLLSPFK